MLFWKYNLNAFDSTLVKIKVQSSWNIIVEMWYNFNYCSVDHVVAKSHIYLQVISDYLNTHIGNKPVLWYYFRCARVIYILELLDDYFKLKSMEMMN